MHLSRASLRTLTSSCKTVLPISHSSKALPTMHLTTIHPRIIICVSSLWVGIPFRAVSQVFLSPCLTLNLWNTLRIDSYWFSVTPPFFQLLEIPIQKTNQLISSSSSEREQEYVLPKRRRGRHTQRGAAPSAAAICTSSECRRPASLPASQPCCPILPPSRSEDHRISRATQRPWLPLQNQWHHDARYKLLFHLIRSKGVWKRKLTSLSWKGQRFVLPLKFPANWILCQLYKGAFHKINVSVWKILLRRGCWLTSENEKGNRFFFFFYLIQHNNRYQYLQIRVYGYGKWGTFFHSASSLFNAVFSLFISGFNDFQAVFGNAPRATNNAYNSQPLTYSNTQTNYNPPGAYNSTQNNYNTAPPTFSNAQPTGYNTGNTYNNPTAAANNYNNYGAPFLSAQQLMQPPPPTPQQGPPTALQPRRWSWKKGHKCYARYWEDQNVSVWPL